MNKTFILAILALLTVFSVTAVSAKTVVAGKIYDSPNFETANAVAGANINATCNGNVLYTTSLADGTYSVSFNTTDCPDGSTVTVWAEKGGVTNSGVGEVHDYTAVMPDLYVGVVNIALIPEFGIVIGTLTALSAIGIFVRRK